MKNITVKMGRLLLSFIVVLLPFSSIFSQNGTAADTPAISAIDDWPMYQHDPAHSGRTPATAPDNQSLYLQWAYSFGERVEVEVQPVIANGVIYVGSMSGKMHAINALNGNIIWSQRPGGPIPHTAAVADNRVYFGSLDGKIYALATNNGAKIWEFATQGPVISAPVIVAGKLYIGSSDGNLYALDAANGNELWHFSTDGDIISSPAVANGLVYFGSEDMYARAVNADSGVLAWETKLYGIGMRNTHPLLSDDGQVVIFVTIKAGATSYVPVEGYPDVDPNANPVATWNSYYQQFPKHRYLYYLNANTGVDLWNPASMVYVPMPIPYWGLLNAILGPDGYAWFPVPAGTHGNAFELNHDSRLIRMNLSTGVAVQVAGGPNLPEFQMRFDEVGRHIFAGKDYFYTISEDLGVFRPTQTGGDGGRRALFTNGDPSGYNFGSHMDPHSPLPSRHLWRYGGVVAMGGVPGASHPVVANNYIYFISYGWIYAVGNQDKGLDPATSFPAHNNRLYELTYPRASAPVLADIRAEITQRVSDILALGPGSPPMTARWDQPGLKMQYNEFPFEVYGYDADIVRTMSEAYPYVSLQLREDIKDYLKVFVSDTLLNDNSYDTVSNCLIYGEPGLQVGEAACTQPNKIISRWLANNRNLVALRLYALWAYADVTQDWDAIASNWSLITSKFKWFTDAYDPSLGFSFFEDWRVGRLNIGAQIAAAQGVRDMADHLGDSVVEQQAAQLLASLLDTRVELANFVPDLYASGQRQPAYIRLNPNGTLVHDDIFGPNSPYNNELIPYSAEVRNQNTDPSQVNWWDGTIYRVDAGMEFMYYPGLSGYFPLSSSLVERLNAELYDKTLYYVKSYEVNQPWWWMTDLAHHTTGSGEHLYESPILSWTMFQVKARVLHENWQTLVHELPEPVSFNAKYDLFRLQNLVTLVEFAKPDLSGSYKTGHPITPKTGEQVRYEIIIQNWGADLEDMVSATDVVPSGLEYVPGSLEASSGTVDDSAAPTLHWSGMLVDAESVRITYYATVAIPEGVVQSITNQVTITSPQVGSLQRSAKILVNGWALYCPLLNK